MRRIVRPLLALLLLAAVAACGDDGDGASDVTVDAPTTTTADTPDPSDQDDAGDPGSGDGSDDPGTTTTTTAVTEPIGEFSMDAVVTSEFPSPRGETTFLEEVRIGAHAGFDRVVFEFTDIVPAHRVGFTEPPIREDGSGNEVQVEGDAFLEVVLAGASGVDLSGNEPVVIYEGPERLAIEQSEVITEVVGTGDFENVMTWVIGLDAQNGFAVEGLEDPSRLVIDIATG